MIVTEDEVETVERIGRLDFSVRRSSNKPESRLHPDERAEALAALLLSQWHREHQDYINN